MSTLHKCLLVASAVAACAAAAAAPKPPARPKCRAWSEALDKQEQDADALNEEALSEELAKRKLTKVELPAEQLLNRVGQAGGVVKQDGDDYFVAGETESPNQPVPDLTFVEDADHALWVVDRDPEIVSTRRYLLCGCGPPTGGGAYMPQTIAYRLPKNRSFKGHIQVRFREKRVQIRWTGIGPDGAICSQPP
jgi:hypothetical protein